MESLDRITEEIRQKFDQRYAAREQGLKLSREVIRSSANAIRAIHRGEYDEARRLMELAQKAVIAADAALRDHPEILFAGFVHDAQKEYAEANLTLALTTGGELPSPDDLGVGYAAYLNGLGEAVGELRRHVLDELRQGKVTRSEGLLQIMDEVYSVLVTIDYPDAMTGGLRRTTDMVRGVTEKTRGDLTLAIRQRQLEMALHDMERKIDEAKGDGA